MKPIEELRKLLLGEWAHRFNLADAERINAILAQPADTPKYFPAKDKYPEIECERCKFLEGELRAVETKIGIENIFEQGKAQGRADAVAAERREINDWIDARAREENGATITMPNAIVEERINILCSIVVAAERERCAKDAQAAWFSCYGPINEKIKRVFDAISATKAVVEPAPDANDDLAWVIFSMREYVGTQCPNFPNCVPAPAPATPSGEDVSWQHVANEWADEATNGLQWLRNVKAGISTLNDAILSMEVGIERCRELKGAK